MKLASVSLAKAVGILLMVLAHSRFSRYGGVVVTMFHMPLFFFFSGYCFKENYLANMKDYVYKKIKGIYFPYVKWSLLFLLAHNFFFSINIYNDTFGWKGRVSHIYTINEIFSHAFHILSGMWDHEQLLGGFWFLGTLFWSSLISYLIIRYVKSRLISLAILLIVSTILCFFNKHIPVVGIGAKEFLASVFFLIGFFTKKFEIRSTHFLWLFPVSIIGVFIGAEYWPMSFLRIECWKIIPWIITAILPIECIFFLCKEISRKKMKFIDFFVFLGDNTLHILTFHFLSFKLVSLLIIYLYGLPCKRLAEFPVISDYAYQGWWLAYFLIGGFAPLIYVLFLKKIKNTWAYNLMK